MESPGTLADYVSRIRQEKRLSLNDVVRQSGNQIANSHVSRIENGLTTNVTTDKLRALAKGLGVSEDEIFAVARGKSVSGDIQLDESRLLEYFRALSPDSRDLLLDYAEMMSMRDRGPGRRVPVVTKGVDVYQQEEKKRA